MFPTTFKEAEADFTKAISAVGAEFHKLEEGAEKLIGIGDENPVAYRPGHQEESAPGVPAKAG